MHRAIYNESFRSSSNSASNSLESRHTKLTLASPNKSLLSSDSANDKSLVSIDPPELRRIFKECIESVQISLESLRSKACFLYICDEEKIVIAWFGSESILEDRDLTFKIGLDIIHKDYGKKSIKEIPVIIEGLELTHQLKYLLDKFWEDEPVYRSKAMVDVRKRSVVNSPLIIYIIEKLIIPGSSTKYLLKEISKFFPNEDGRIPRATFPDIHKDSKVAICSGQFWELWITRSVFDESDNLIMFLSNYIIENSSNQIHGFINAQSIKLTIQGLERRMFKQYFKILTDFDPDNKLAVLNEIYPNSPNSIVNDNLLSDLDIASDRSLSERTPPGILKTDLFNKSDKVKKNIRINISENDDSENNKNEKYDTNSNSFREINRSISSISEEDNLSKNENILRMPTFMMSKEELKLLEKDKKRNKGKYLLKEDMMIFNEKLNIPPVERAKIMLQCLDNPSIIVGWQIEIDFGYLAGISVITDYKKPSFFSKSEYRISKMNIDESLDSYSPFFDDVWVNLKKSSNSNGLSFRLLRKVLNLNDNNSIFIS